MTTVQAAAYLQVTKVTLARLEKNEGLPFHRLSSANRSPKRYYRTEIDRWVRSRWSANNPDQRR